MLVEQECHRRILDSHHSFCINGLFSVFHNQAEFSRTSHYRQYEIGVDQPGEALAALRAEKENLASGIQEVELYGSLIHVFSKGNAETQKQIKEILRRNMIEINYMEEIEPSLEDVFISCMHQNKQGKEEWRTG